MKKMLIFLVTVLFALGCSAALAGCSEHPEAEDYFTLLRTEYTYWNDNFHKWQDFGFLSCEVCDAYIRDDVLEFLDYHTIVDQMCYDCDHYFAEGYGIPTHEVLQAEALKRITEDPDGIAGKTATVIHDGNLRAEADRNSTALGAAVKGDEYEILSYLIVENRAVWLEVESGIGSAWISASLVEISGKNAVDDSDADNYIGQRCTIKVSSGRARLAPDKAAPVVGYVHYGEKYRILDCQAADDGTLWFQIKIDNKEGWISSGIASTN